MTTVTYILKTDEFSESGFYSACLSRVSVYRRSKVLSYVFEKDRKLSLAAGILIDFGLSRYGLTENDRDIVFGKNGKPFPKSGNVFFNVSHSGNFAVCAFSENDVGADIEEISDISDELIESVCAENESAYIKTFCGNMRRREFFRLWTAKESYMKLLGTGLSLHPKKIELSLGDNISMKEPRVFFKEYPAENYCITVCGRENDFSPEAEYLTAADIRKELMI